MGSGGPRRQRLRRLGMALVLLFAGGCPSEPEDLRAQAEKLIRQGVPEAALARVDRHLARVPHDSAARLLRVELLIQVHAVDEALREYGELGRIQGEHHPALLGRILTAYLQEEIAAGGMSRVRAAPLVASLPDPALLPLLVELASTGDPAARAVAVDALSRLNLAPAVSFLTRLLDDPDPSARAQAARGLGRSGVDREELAPLLTDEWESVRMAAAEGLARLGDARATPVLRQGLKSPRGSVRMQAAEALGVLGDREAAPALVELLKDSDEYVRLYAAEALARIGEAEGLSVLRRALRHPSVSLRLYAAEALSNLHDPSPLPLLRRVVADPSMTKEERLYAAWTLGRLDDPSGIRHIQDLLHDADPFIRLRAAWTLGEIRNPEASPLLRAALEDRERAVRIHVAWALYQLSQARPHPRG